MNAETLIRDEADKFVFRYLEDYESEHDGARSFKNKLNERLKDYYDALDKLIFLYKTDHNIDTIYSKHLESCSHRDEPQRCEINKYYLKCKNFVEQEIKELNPAFDYTILRPNINSNLLRQNLVQLSAIPQAGKLFQSALDKLNESRFERNLLDDLRLTLEIALKHIFSNEKSLENQLESVGRFLKQKDTSKELTNMFRQLIDYYSKYQNTYVKHDNNIKQDEIELIVNLTSAFINFLINKK